MSKKLQLKIKAQLNELNSTGVLLTLDSTRVAIEQKQTVEELLTLVKQKFGLENSKLNVGLFLPPPNGFFLGETEQIEKYKLSDMETLELRVKKTNIINGNIPVEKGQLIVKVAIPETGAVFSILCQQTDMIADVEKSVISKAHLDINEEDYGFWCSDEELQVNSWLESSKTIGSYCLKNMQLLQFKKKLSKIKVGLFGNFLEIMILPRTLVSDIIEQLKLHPSVDTTEGYGLFLPSKASLTGLLLENSRTILSYRLKTTDVLYFRELPDDLILSSRLSLLSDPKVVFVVIDSACHGISKTLKLQKDNTIREVLELFIRKNPVQNVSEYGLSYSLPKEKSVFLDLDQTLEHYKICNMSTLQFKQTTRPRKNTSIKPKDPVFGIPLETVPTLEDGELQIPKPLVLLKQSLITYDAFKIEGIFRLAGSELNIKQIKLDLNLGTFTESSDVHSCATLIKRWLGELPKRLFDSFSTSEIKNATESPESARELVTRLPENEKKIFNWLVDLCSMVVLEKEVNKMTPNNLAIVIAPQLYNLNSIDPLDGLFISQNLVVILHQNIIYWMKEKYDIEISPETEQMGGAIFQKLALKNTTNQN